MKVYRIARTAYVRDISGIGAKLYGGRWNNKGVAVLYTTEYRSLAALEVLVHLNRNELPEDLSLLSLDISETSIVGVNQYIAEAKLGKNATINYQKLGTNWLLSKESLCLKVPSVIIKEECNILINPNHELFKKITIDSIDEFYFDKRLEAKTVFFVLRRDKSPSLQNKSFGSVFFRVIYIIFCSRKFVTFGCLNEGSK